jgi:hypothetical protein
MPQMISKNPNGNHSAKYVLILLVLIIISLAAGFYLGKTGSWVSKNPYVVSNFSKNAEAKKGSYDEGYQAALDFARKKLEEKGLFSGSRQIFGLPSATIKSINGYNIIVEFDASVLDLFGEGKVTKTVIVSDPTVIQQNIPKSIQDYQKEEDSFLKQMDEINAKIKAGEPVDKTVIVQSPTPYTIKKIGLNDLKIGDVITVAGKYDSANPDTFKTNAQFDITKSDNIEAASITLSYIPEQPKEDKDNLFIKDMAPAPTDASEKDVNPPSDVQKEDIALPVK